MASGAQRTGLARFHPSPYFDAVRRPDGNGNPIQRVNIVCGLTVASPAARDTGRAMSQENVEIVRRIYDEGLIDKDPEWLLELATPDIEYVNPPHAVERGVRHGPDEVVRAMRAFAEVWEKSRHELHELFDCGDIVVAAVSWHTRSRGSEADLVQEEAHSWSLRKGRIARFEWGRDLGSALDSAGLRG